MKQIRIPGFYPLNWYVWKGEDAHGHKWRTGLAIRYRFRMLVNHARFLPKWVKRVIG